MRRTHRRQQGKSSIELIEEATHLLRTAPSAVLASYYVGSVPFILGLLYFWADMSRNPFAPQHQSAAALGLAVLFLWMKCWHVVFTRKLRALISVEPATPWSFTHYCRIFVTQTVLQSSGLFVLPLALLPVIPFPWVYAFYQNLTALDDGEPGRIRALFLKAARQATLWPGQNHIALAILLAFAFCVFLNWSVFCLYLPSLVKMLFGIESVFSRGGEGMLNTTFFAAMFGLTYLSVDPIGKTIYVFRCFYGDSLKSGEDLKAELKHFSLEARAIAASIILFLSLAATGSLQAAESATPSPPAPGQMISPSGIPPSELDRAIEDVINRSKYKWRMPRDKNTEAAEKGVIARFLDNVATTLKKAFRATVDWLDEVLRKLFRRNRESAGGDTSGYGWIMIQQIFLYTFVAVVAVALLYLLYRVFRAPTKRGVLQSEAIQPTPDLTDEDVGADRLPEDGWTKLARELLERGEFRLALRAFYLASLAHLAARNLVSLAKFKSNNDYERELQRRGHSFPNLSSAFGEAVAVFDRVWYGLHEVNGELVQRFAANVERIKTGG